MIISLNDASFIDYYDRHIPDRGDIYLRRLSTSSILSRPNSINFLKSKLGLTPVPSYRLNDSNIETLIGGSRSTPAIVYYDEEVHNGAGKRLIDSNELRDSNDRQGILKRLIGSFAADFIPTSPDPLNISVTTTYFQIGNRSYWVEYTGAGWMSNYATSYSTRLLDSREIAANWQAQQDAIDRAQPILAKMPIVSIDFLTDVRDRAVYASDLNLAPRVGDTAIVEVLTAESCWDEIGNYVAANLDIIYDYLIVSGCLPDRMQDPAFRLTKTVELRYIPPGSYWQCVEDGSYWKYLHGLKDSERYFWRQKTSHGMAGALQLHRGDIFKGRTYQLIP